MAERNMTEKVRTHDAKDGFDGWRIVQAQTEREWAAVQLLRQKYFFKSNIDPYTWTFERKDHVHSAIPASHFFNVR
jgi:hypothetical protein